MKIFKDTFRPEMARIKRELEALRKMTVHVGIMGDAGSDLLMIAGVHEYGATIRAKNVKNLSIPLTKEAKDAGSPRKFNDLEWIPGHDPNVSFLVRPRKLKAKANQKRGREQREFVQDKTEFDPSDYDWLYMLVKSVEIPERSFIRASYDAGQRRLEDLCKEAVDGIIRQGWTAREAADYVGNEALKMTRNYFDTKLKPEKSSTTLLTTTQYQPLYDTGRLYRSITYRVERGNT